MIIILNMLKNLYDDMPHVYMLKFLMLKNYHVINLYDHDCYLPYITCLLYMLHVCCTF